ncbi:hypothetical protein BKA70DRAFT_1567946 [Coprinopsis sp. MPI-PUGE-AT-0042]|nr:hypothetical protein BKA70DRAFT_1567946 [Coprinopsis sp. MPI-PUGE-AT-0042]
MSKETLCSQRTCIPVLEGHLSHLTESIDRLDNEILALESLLDATRKAQRLLKQERRAHSKIKAPIRRIPPELLGVIFGCLFGDSPFEAGEYRQFTRLASVCAAWREIMYTTPNLCKGLAIDVNEWRRHPPVREGQARLASLQASWSPWLAIVSRSSTYHLKLSAEIGGQCNEAFVRYLLSSIPAPDILTLNSRRAFHLSLRLKECPSIRHLNLTEALDTEDVPLSPLPSVFPNLQILVVDPFINISHQPPFQHGHIRVLHMRDLDGNPLQFSNFMKNLPSLCELQISSREPIGVGHTGANNTDFFSHPSLQALIVHGEDMIHLLSQVTFPALKFFCLRSRGRSEAARAFKETLPNLFSRSHVQNLTVSLQGTLLPHGSRLHLDVGHIYKPLEGNGDATITIDS